MRSQEFFRHLPRSDQRHWADVYVRGLLTAEGRKSPRALALAGTGSPEPAHALHQFVSHSPWDWRPVRHLLAQRVGAELPARALVLGAALIPKRGGHSVGVAAHFDPDAGRAVNAQLGMGLFVSDGHRAVPVDWRLVLDEAWCADHRRRRARLPDSAAPRPAWQDALALAAGAGELPVVVDARRTPGPAALVAGLARRGAVFLAETGPGQRVVPAGGPARAVRVDELPAYDGDDVVATALVRPLEAGTEAAGAPVLRLWRLGAPGTGRARWALTNARRLAAGGVRALLRHADAAGAVLPALSTDFGLCDYEGRSYPGWHRHMTLVSVAYALAALRCEAARAPLRRPPARPCTGLLARGA
ncbi:transposase [Streptomyces sp. NPDC048191]|uniref:IS701 family transposase n=1 Tax=Streptomyces sp. NPDC048191 TaxID=3155484 RepID=UPI0033EC3A1C